MSYSSFLISLCPFKFSIRTDLLIKFDMISELNEKVKWLIELILPKIDSEEKVNLFLEDCLKECQPKFTEIKETEFSLFLNSLKENPKTKKIDTLYEINLYSEWFVSNGSFIIPFGEINGNFNASQLRELISLKNCPNIVHGNFLCFDCNLDSLKYSPKIVEGFFAINNNFRLSSLENGPEKVNSNYYCHDCCLTSLKGAPKKIFGNFICRNNCLSSLENGPTEVDEVYNCANNKLITLKGAPKKINSHFICSENYSLKSLKYGPEQVNGNYYCNYCDIYSLNDYNLKCKGYFECSNNKKLKLEEITAFRKKCI